VVDVREEKTRNYCDWSNEWDNVTGTVKMTDLKMQDMKFQFHVRHFQSADATSKRKTFIGVADINIFSVQHWLRAKLLR